MSLQRILIPATLLALAPFVRAETGEQPEKPAAAFSEAVVEKLDTLRTLTDAKRHDEAAKLLRELIAAAPAGSYDRFALSQVLAQVSLARNRPADAIAPLEDALRTGDAAGFLDAAKAAGIRELLGHIRYRLSQEPENAANTGALLRAAVADYRAAVSRKGAATAADRLRIASILLAIGLRDDRETAALEDALKEIKAAQSLAAAPSEEARTVELAALLKLGRNAEAADILDLLVALKPDAEDYRRRLVAVRLALAAAQPDEELSRPLRIAALLAYESAQKAGFLRTPRDNRSVVALLLSLDRVRDAAAGLDRGIAAGTIEDTPENRELLANSLVRGHRDAEAAKAYAAAIARFPDDAGLELAYGNLLYAGENLSGAYDRTAAAVSKKGLRNPGRTRFFLAYLAYELRRHDDALKWTGEAAKFPDADPAAVARLAAAAKAARETANG